MTEIFIEKKFFNNNINSEINTSPTKNNNENREIIRKLEGEIKELKSSNNMLKFDLGSLKRSNVELRQQLEITTSENMELNNNYNGHMSNIFEGFNKKLSIADESLQKYNEEKERCDSLEMKNKELEKKISESAQRLFVLEEEVKEQRKMALQDKLQSTIASIKREMQTLYINQFEEKSAEFEKYKINYDLLCHEYDELQEKCDILNEQKELLNDILEDKEEKIVEYKRLILNLLNKVKESEPKKKKNSNKKRADDLESENSKLKSELVQINTLFNSFSNNNDSIDSLKREILKLKASLDCAEDKEQTKIIENQNAILNELLKSIDLEKARVTKELKREIFVVINVNSNRKLMECELEDLSIQDGSGSAEKTIETEFLLKNVLEIVNDENFSKKQMKKILKIESTNNRLIYDVLRHACKKTKNDFINDLNELASLVKSQKTLFFNITQGIHNFDKTNNTNLGSMFQVYRKSLEKVINKENETKEMISKNQIEELNKTLVNSAREISKMRELQSQLLTELQRSDEKISQQMQSLQIQHKKEIVQWTNAFYKEKAENLKLQDELLEIKGNIRVFCRLRPILKKEQDSSRVLVEYSKTSITFQVNKIKK